MKTGAIILCGGKSSRMGRDKATLPFGPELMLQRVVRLLSDVIDPRNMVVVAAPGQQLPVLPFEVTIARDHRDDRGPLEGLFAGSSALAADIEAAYVTSCDVPLLLPAFVRRMLELLGDDDIAVPVEGEQFHTLASVYRSSVRTIVERFLAEDRLRLRSLLDEVRTRRVSVENLRDVDPDLQSLINLNDADDYHEALVRAGLATTD